MFNLSTIEEFLNVVNSSGAHPVDGHMDEQACHWAHERLFESTLVSAVRLSLLFTLLLCTNYPALWQSSALKIPNGELRKAWDDVVLTAIFNSDSSIAWANERKSMLDRLYVGNMRDTYQ
ncbi:hypothetical protein GQ54DRAFT_300744 [Martensiomyces pterosporus]|nr:hypothetical protein GQ54DRAFT_300744 [Martensiomyces pterosporus]